MPNKEDFSWENSKIKNGNTLGKIVSIPAHGDSDIEPSKDIRLNVEDRKDIVVDEFKEKMAEILSRELHQNK
ncbi:hypothetical protein [Methanolobus psychrotolerans]|uniref:hypothetical protein n=1 Tax=Methanolobus psychrotolerans TaxID=1874706 RepID=UPI000B91832E|nr:hypothetical protein [Methanolobus psychrotolerans]